MIAKQYTQRHKLVFGNKPEDIERYNEAISSNELYVPHHVLEFMYTIAELESMNRYWLVSPDELIWMPQSVHKNNPTLHKGCKLKYEKEVSAETRAKLSAVHKGVKFTDEHKANISKGQTGKKRGPLSEEHKAKLREKSRAAQLNNPSFGSKGMHWYNDGTKNIFAYECPAGCSVGRIKKKG